MSGATGERSDMSFEEAFRLLQQRVNALTAGRLPLAEALATFEEGLELYRHCARLLQDAELRVSRALEAVQGPSEA